MHCNLSPRRRASRSGL